MLSNAESISTVPPAGAFVHELDAGLLTVTDAVLFELLYVAVIVEDPAATPVTGMFADVCPAGTLTEAGTVAFVGSELLTDTVATEDGALDSVTVNPSIPPTDTPMEDGDSVLTVGFAGVVPSVVKLMTGFSRMLLLFSVAEVRCEINVSFSPASITAENEYGSGVVVVMSVLVNFVVASCFAMNRTLPGAENRPVVPDTRAVPSAGAVHSSTASFIVPLELCRNPPFQMARYNSSPTHFAFAETYVISAPDESLYLHPF